MDRTAQVTAEGRRSDEATNGWAPTSVMIVHGNGVRTSVRYNPLEPNRALGSRWKVRARVYGRRPLEPIWEEESDWIEAGRGQYELVSDRLAEALGLEELAHYAEFHPYSPDRPPTHEQIAAPLFAHYTSDDGSFEAHIPSAYMYGASRSYKMVSGWKYQNFPYVELGGPFDLRIYSMNQTLKKVAYGVILVPGDGGGPIESDMRAMRPKSVDAFDERLVEHEDPRPYGVIIKSDLRIASFVGVFNREQGRLIGLDHTHPFFPG
jgi:hypothetical protein